MLTIPVLTSDPIAAEALESQVRNTEHGAVVIFQGVVRRDKTETGEIAHLFYEAYEDMVQKELTRLLQEIQDRWPKTSAAVQHRIGRVLVGETSVFIAVSSPHRSHAFEACRFLIDQIKTSMPIWKKDVFTNGQSRWSPSHHETMLVSDTSVDVPVS